MLLLGLVLFVLSLRGGPSSLQSDKGLGNSNPVTEVNGAGLTANNKVDAATLKNRRNLEKMFNAGR